MMMIVMLGLFFRYCVEVFDHMSISAMIDNGAVFGVHGGLSPSVSGIDQIR
jgi:serine/threonine-protein phosphatase 4 catalytic subunit